ncbi:MAG: SDR family NAD(P)-dependent oxidoreductase [Alphaproteobacteria bacterium]|jgi:NAD(P)-dependent dehydrogenase (short-subunit alcohol dehydrogenase family)|nr:SDR family NAD(P)-dependent oxidoreductase [Alphaproteobacteria bacterium]MDP6589030.1 SDR family NAD(P)-dependent oxidoreductase [Alphaproteobacteria bacterium]MDP6819280.1 SDR family NAD(P)-dependent oxidoreductase [Alphaproteobacteria bacterium]
MDTSLAGKRALVTGAGDGIGREIAEALAREGAIVAVHGRAAARIAATLEAIEGAGGKAIPALADLMDEDAINAMCGEALDSLGGLDILVNNAGICTLQEVPRMTPETWKTILATNLTAPFLVSRAVYPALVESGAGASVIFISSIASAAHAAGWGAYAASKNGLDAFMHCLADELGAHGVRVNSIAPGWIETKMAQQLHKSLASAAGAPFEALYNENMRGNMLNALLTPDSIADMAVFLVSERGRFITAQTLAVCGGCVPGSGGGGSTAERAEALAGD